MRKVCSPYTTKVHHKVQQQKKDTEGGERLIESIDNNKRVVLSDSNQNPITEKGNISKSRRSFIISVKGNIGVATKDNIVQAVSATTGLATHKNTNIRNEIKRKIENEKITIIKKERSFTRDISTIFFSSWIFSYNPIKKKDYARIADVENYQIHGLGKQL